VRKLGHLEAEVMERLWSRESPATVREVLEDLQRDRRLAYTTVMTVMDKLHAKGVLARELDGRAYRYRPVQSREQHTAALIEQVLSASTDREAACCISCTRYRRMRLRACGQRSRIWIGSGGVLDRLARARNPFRLRQVQMGEHRLGGRVATAQTDERGVEAVQPSAQDSGRVAAPTRGSQPNAPPNRFVAWIVLGCIMLLVGVVAIYVAMRGEDGAGSAPAVELEHVHGLGVDPADGVLYAGSHHGLFRLPEDGEGVRVADRVQDFMGFTVVGPRHFLASGHPGEGDEGPSSLGLIESTDAGQSWQSVSLAGEADFHALEAKHGLIYGYNSLTQAFLVSRDTVNWETRSQVPMADFTVSPDEPGVVLATTEGGLARSQDGGSTFQLLEQAPRLLLVTWTAGSGMVGVDPAGQVFVTTDPASSWQRRGSVGDQPEAFAVAGDEIYAAIGGASIVVSSDGGRSFRPYFPSSPSAKSR
jgi:predicted transcriptional regulator